MSQDAEAKSPECWLGLAAEIMHFLRQKDCIAAVDREVWLFKGNTLDQLAAMLQTRLQPAHGIHRHPQTQQGNT